MFTGIIFVKETFSYDFIDQVADQPTCLCAMKFHYKSSLTGGLILCFGLVCLLLVCLGSDFNVHVLQLFFLFLLCSGCR